MNKIKKMYNKYSAMPPQIRASLWFLICSIIQKGISVITTPIFTRIMSSAEYGRYSVFSSWQGIVCAIIILTLPYGVFPQGLVKFNDNKEKFTSNILGLMTALSAVWFVIYLVFRNLINSLLSLNTFEMICMFFLTWASSVFSFWAMCERNEFKYKKLVLITLAVSLLKPTVGIILVSNCVNKVDARVFGTTAIDLLFFSGLFVAMMRRGGELYSKEKWKYALVFNLPLIPHYLSQRVLNSADRIMISSMVSENSAGIYSLAYSLSSLLYIVNKAIEDTLSPWMFKKIKENKFSDISKIAYPSIVFVAGLNLLLIAFAPEAVRLFAPEEYYEAIYVIPPVTMSVFFMFLYFFFVNFEFYYEKTKNISSTTIAGALLNVLLNYLLIPKFGYMAAGYTTLACYILYAVFHYFCMRKICKENLAGVRVYNMSTIVVIAVLFMAMGFLISLNYKTIFIRYGIIAILIFIAFFTRKQTGSLIKQVLEK